MGKRLYDSMLREVEAVLNEAEFELLDLEDGSRKNDAGVEETFTRLELEICRGNGAFSRCRFSCKVPRVKLNITPEEMEDGVLVKLDSLAITFISANREIYTKAEGVHVQK